MRFFLRTVAFVFVTLWVGCIYGPLIEDELERAPFEVGDADVRLVDMGFDLDGGGVRLDTGEVDGGLDRDQGVLDAGEVEMGEPDAGTPFLTLPFAADDHFPDRLLSGEGGMASHTHDNACPQRAKMDAVGLCHRFRWNGSRAFTESAWTIGSALSELQSQSVDPRATRVQFYAWGRRGGESIRAGVGVTDLDPFRMGFGYQLSTTPELRTLPFLTLAGATEVYSPFFIALFVANNPNVVEEELEFYIDDIRWTR